MQAKGEIAELPASARIKFISAALQRERRMRERVLKGSGREQGVKEMDACLEYLTHVDAALQRAKGIEEQHKAMCFRLRQCAERHGLSLGADYLDIVILDALEDAMLMIRERMLAGKEGA